MANDDEFLPLDGFEEVGDFTKGWRIESNSNGKKRWRWQKKHADGTPETYINSSGKKGYSRGSKYVSDNEINTI